MAQMGVRAYARHRGCSHVAVLNAIKSGRLSKSVTRDAKGQPLIDAEMADTEWIPTTKEAFKEVASGNPGDKFKESNDEIEDEHPRSSAPSSSASEKPLANSYAQARAVRENYMARLAKLEFEQKSGKLIPAEEVEKKWAQIGSLLRTKILGVPSKARQLAPELTDEQFQILKRVVREALEEISEDGPSYVDDQ